MVECMSFGICEIKILLPIFLSIFMCLQAVLQNTQQHLLNKDQDNPPHFYTFLIIIFGSKTLFIFPLIISCIVHKNKTVSKRKTQKRIVLKIMILILVSCLEYASTTLKYFYYYFYNDSPTKHFDIFTYPFSKSFFLIFISLLSKCILKQKIYLHKKIAIILTTLSIMLFLFLLSLKSRTIMTNEKSNDYSYKDSLLSFAISMGIALMFTLSESIKEISENYIMENKYVSPYLILLVEGCIQGIFMYILNIRLKLLEHKSEQVFINDFKYHYIFLSLFLVCSVFLEAFRVQSNNHYGPSFRVVGDSLLFSVSLIFNEKYFKYDLILYSIPFGVVIYLLTLVYNDLIVFDFCGLDSYSKKVSKKKEQYIGDISDIGEIDYNDITQDDLSESFRN